MSWWYSGLDVLGFNLELCISSKCYNWLDNYGNNLFLIKESLDATTREASQKGPDRQSVFVHMHNLMLFIQVKKE